MKHSTNRAVLHAFAWVSIVGVITVMSASSAWAQVGPTGTPGGVSPLIGGSPDTKRQAPQQQPDALPGAKPNAERVSPVQADHPVAAMEPTDALFDAINRGDIGSARDAINRGADLGSRNLLGMTPMELSVDLNRNDITFLLLSLRGSDTNKVGAPLLAGGKAPPSKTAKQQAQRRLVSQPKGVAQAAPPVPQTAKLFAGNGGTPNLNAGFLGFDSGRSAP